MTTSSDSRWIYSFRMYPPIQFHQGFCLPDIVGNNEKDRLEYTLRGLLIITTILRLDKWHETDRTQS